MVNLIAHGLIIQKNKVLLIKRSKIKRGRPNFNAERWDVPGGIVEVHEPPRKTVEREVKEETNCIVRASNLLYDMYQYDLAKEKEFLTLVYQVDLIYCSDIRLDPDEHTEYKWVSLDDLLAPSFSLDILEYILPSLKALYRISAVI